MPCCILLLTAGHIKLPFGFANNINWQGESKPLQMVSFNSCLVEHATDAWLADHGTIHQSCPPNTRGRPNGPNESSSGRSQHFTTPNHRHIQSCPNNDAKQFVLYIYIGANTPLLSHTHTYIHTYIDTYITLHYITLHYTTLHYIHTLLAIYIYI